ncbi:MAG TPA: L,D-transpeptidase [Polyangiaceae bacterium]|nr:L,D-transpeptidase [Polyangiaceae bacterium]
MRARESVAWLLALVSWLSCPACKARAVTATSDAADEASETDEVLAASTASADAAAPRMAAALKYDTPIFNRPEFPPKDPTRTADEKAQAIRLGSLRKGQRVSVKGDAGKGGGCSEGWVELAGGGFVCNRFLTADFTLKELQSAPHPPYEDRPLPYDYGLNLTNGTPMYRRAPLRRERAVYEKGLLVKGKTEEDRAEAAKEITAEKGETPWYLSEKSQRANVTLDDLKGESALVEQRMVRGFYVALDQEVHAFAGKFWRTTRGSFIPFDHILVHKSTTEFEGVWVGHDDEPRKLPLAFVLRPIGAREYRFPTEGQAPARGADRVPRFTIVALTGKHVVFEERNYYESTEGYWLRDLDITMTKPGPPPADLGSGEKWIDVNVSAQSLVAFEGTKPVFATWVSTGKRNPQDEAKDHPTPVGSFRIREKHVATTMDDDSATDGPYSIEDVPWVMYFEKGYALHGAFWHSAFGREHSHGCVNMTPHDAKELFGWVGPTLPPGWHAVRGTAANPGTRVIVHE